MSALLELLKKAGAKPEDLEAMRPMLENEQYNSAYTNELKAREDARVAAEAKAKEFETQSTQYKTQVDDYTEKVKAAETRVQSMQDWYEKDATPAYQAAMNDAIKAREQAAALEARLKAAEEYGFNVPKVDPPVAPVVVPVVAPVQTADLPDLSKYATTDTLNSFYSQAGDAIEMAQDITSEHFQLFGFEKPLSFHELRKEAITEKKPIRDVWEKKFNVSGRKAEIEAASQAKIAAARAAELEQARKEGLEQGRSEISSPFTRDAMPSKNPTLAFSTKDRSGSNPWQGSGAIDRSNERAQKVLTTLAKQSA